MCSYVGRLGEVSWMMVDEKTEETGLRWRESPPFEECWLTDDRASLQIDAGWPVSAAVDSGQDRNCNCTGSVLCWNRSALGRHNWLHARNIAVGGSDVECSMMVVGAMLLSSRPRIDYSGPTSRRWLQSAGAC